MFIIIGDVHKFIVYDLLSKVPSLPEICYTLFTRVHVFLFPMTQTKSFLLPAFDLASRYIQGKGNVILTNYSKGKFPLNPLPFFLPFLHTSLSVTPKNKFYFKFTPTKYLILNGINWLNSIPWVYRNVHRRCKVLGSLLYLVAMFCSPVCLLYYFTSFYYKTKHTQLLVKISLTNTF